MSFLIYAEAVIDGSSSYLGESDRAQNIYSPRQKLRRLTRALPRGNTKFSRPVCCGSLDVHVIGVTGTRGEKTVARDGRRYTVHIIRADG